MKLLAKIEERKIVITIYVWTYIKSDAQAIAQHPSLAPWTAEEKKMNSYTLQNSCMISCINYIINYIKYIINYKYIYNIYIMV